MPDAPERRLPPVDAHLGDPLPDALGRRLPPLDASLGKYSATHGAQVGTRILLVGLKRIDLNGNLGAIISVDCERAGVLLEKTGHKMAVRYGNLLMVGTGPPPSGPSMTARFSSSSPAECGVPPYAQQHPAAPFGVFECPPTEYLPGSWSD